MLNFIIEFIVELLAELLKDFLTNIGFSTLDTKKIDQNIERLRQQDWFKQIYEDEKYHHLFFANKHVRRYLQSTRRVRKMRRSEKAQRKFLRLVDKQIN